MAPAELLALADCFCRGSQLRIERLFTGIHHNTDRAGYRLAQQVLEGKCSFLEEGIVQPRR